MLLWQGSAVCCRRSAASGGQRQPQLQRTAAASIGRGSWRPPAAGGSAQGLTPAPPAVVPDLAAVLEANGPRKRS